MMLGGVGKPIPGGLNDETWLMQKECLPKNGDSSGLMTKAQLVVYGLDCWKIGSFKHSSPPLPPRLLGRDFLCGQHPQVALLVGMGRKEAIVGTRILIFTQYEWSHMLKRYLDCVKNVWLRDF